MTKLDEAIEIYKEQKTKNPNFDTEMVEHFMDKMAKEFTRVMFEKKYGCHIYDEELYDEAVHLLEWVDGRGKGAKWKIDDIVRTSGINFDMAEFTKYDFCYVVNMIYSDYCNVFTEASYFIKMAKNYLSDPDYCGEASERAYHNAMKRIKYVV